MSINGHSASAAGFSFAGPLVSNPCKEGYGDWIANATYWFETMGYPTDNKYWPTKEEIRSHIQSTETAVFYEIAHGTATGFSSGCVDGLSMERTTAEEIRQWMQFYTKVPFVFLASCNAMTDTGPGTLSYELTKGSSKDTAVIGYSGISEDRCDSCWSAVVDFQDVFFEAMSGGLTITDAYLKAMIEYPQCLGNGNACIRFVGDPNLKLVPILERGSIVTDPEADDTQRNSER